MVSSLIPVFGGLNARQPVAVKRASQPQQAAARSRSAAPSPPERLIQGPTVLSAIASQALRVAGLEAFGQWARRTQVQAVDSADHQIGRLQLLLPHVVGPVSAAKAVILAVELGDHARVGV